MSFEPKSSELSTDHNPVMNEAQAAKYIGKGVKTLQRRRQAGQIAYIRDGGIRYLREDLDAYLADRRVAATAPPLPERKSKYRRTGTNSDKNRAALLDII